MEVKVFDPVQPFENYLSSRSDIRQQRLEDEAIGQQRTTFQNALSDRQRRISQEGEDREFKKRLDMIGQDQALSKLGMDILTTIDPDAPDFQEQIHEGLTNFTNALHNAGYEPEFIDQYARRVFQSGLATPDGVRALQEKAGIRKPSETEKTADRKTAKDAEGYLRYIDTKERVFPEAKKPEEEPDFKDVQKLREEFTGSKEVKDYSEIQSQASRMEEALSESKTTESFIAVDQALITVFNKMLDPTSVVRESEYARTPEDQAVWSRLKGKKEKLLTGGAGLTNTERKALTRMARRFAKIAEQRYQKKRSFFEKEAKRAKIDPERILGAGDIGPIKKKIEPQMQPSHKQGGFKFLGFEEE